MVRPWISSPVVVPELALKRSCGSMCRSTKFNVSRLSINQGVITMRNEWNLMLETNRISEYN